MRSIFSYARGKEKLETLARDAQAGARAREHRPKPRKTADGSVVGCPLVPRRRRVASRPDDLDGKGDRDLLAPDER